VSSAAQPWDGDVQFELTVTQDSRWLWVGDIIERTWHDDLLRMGADDGWTLGITTIGWDATALTRDRCLRKLQRQVERRKVELERRREAKRTSVTVIA
jgi:hypothetical protein